MIWSKNHLTLLPLYAMLLTNVFGEKDPLVDHPVAGEDEVRGEVPVFHSFLCSREWEIK
jgi:hypothetical protein